MKFRNIFELTEDEKRIYFEVTKVHLLEGYSKWSAKVAIRGRSRVVFRLTDTLASQDGVPTVSVGYYDCRNSGVVCRHQGSVVEIHPGLLHQHSYYAMNNQGHF